jgi:hypothetical protein
MHNESAALALAFLAVISEANLLLPLPLSFLLSFPEGNLLLQPAL